MTPFALQQTYERACLAELQALKPGNVHIFADGHDMDISHFMKSAQASAPALCEPASSVGQRVLAAAEATHAAVKMNTNLGILLLCAPVLHACLAMSATQTITLLNLRAELANTLSALTVEDGQLAAKAIVIANPAGLGQKTDLDVNDQPQATLLALMQAAQHEDRIAWQYANAFSDVFDFALPVLKQGQAAWEKTAWATSWLYINLLAMFADTHLARKYGQAMAQTVQQEAKAMLQQWQAKGHPKYLTKEMLDWDTALKKRKLNPGTSADLTVCTLLIDALCKSL